MLSPLTLLWLQVMPGPGFIDVGPKRDVWPVSRSHAPAWPAACDVEQRTAALRRYVPALRALFQTSLKRSPGLGGHVVLRLKVDERGAVTSAEAQDSTLSDPELAQGIAALARRWRFPDCAAGWEMSLPLVFTPG